MRVIVGVTGASGAIYARRLVEELLRAKAKVILTVSGAGAQVVEHELRARADWSKPAEAIRAVAGRAAPDVTYYPHDRIAAPIASGSFQSDAMVVAPCSASTMGAIAGGISLNLLHRAADVTLKERRPLILLLRETPLNLVHIENMRAVTLAGATVIPAMAAFYNHPKTIADQVDFLVGRVLDHLRIRHGVGERYEMPGPEKPHLPKGKSQ